MVEASKQVTESRKNLDQAEDEKAMDVEIGPDEAEDEIGELDGEVELDEADEDRVGKDEEKVDQEEDLAEEVDEDL